MDRVEELRLLAKEDVVSRWVLIEEEPGLLIQIGVTRRVIEALVDTERDITIEFDIPPGSSRVAVMLVAGDDKSGVRKTVAKFCIDEKREMVQ